MKVAAIFGLTMAGLAVAACQATMSEAAQVILAGTTNIDVATNPMREYRRPDGSECQVYRYYRIGVGVARQGQATVCRYRGQKWILISRVLDPLPATPGSGDGGVVGGGDGGGGRLVIRLAGGVPPSWQPPELFPKRKTTPDNTWDD